MDNGKGKFAVSERLMNEMLAGLFTDMGEWDIHIDNDGIKAKFSGGIYDKIYIFCHLAKTLKMDADEVELFADFYINVFDKSMVFGEQIREEEYDG